MSMEQARIYIRRSGGAAVPVSRLRLCAAPVRARARSRARPFLARCVPQRIASQEEAERFLCCRWGGYIVETVTHNEELDRALERAHEAEEALYRGWKRRGERTEALQSLIDEFNAANAEVASIWANPREE